MEEIEIQGSSNFSKIVIKDVPGVGNACHEYEVVAVKKERLPYDKEETFPVYAKVSFQNGPIKEAGVNGCHHEDLLNIVLHRLQSFQSGDFRCRENAIAITKLEEAAMWLNKRTQKRVDKGVEGTNVNHE